jgi:hypothetical protein
MRSAANTATVEDASNSPLGNYAGKDLFTIADCQKILGLSRATVWRLVGCGQLDSIMVGGRRMIKRLSLLRVIEVGAEF